MQQNVLLAILAISSLTASGRSLLISSSSDITRNAGTTIPLTFTASGFVAGTTVQILLVNANTWVGEVIESVPVLNGVNSRQVEIPWSWEVAGRYVLKIVSGTTHAWDSRVITIRSAVIWPYFGTVYPKGGIGWVTWVTGEWDLGIFMTVSLVNEDTGETYDLGYSTDPSSGRFELNLPYVTGNHFRIHLNFIDGFTPQTDPEDPDSGQSIITWEQSTRSALVSIK